MKPFRQQGVAFGREMRFDFTCEYNLTTQDITANKNIENEVFTQSTSGHGNFNFDLNFFETSKFEKITEQTNVTIGNLIFFDIRAQARYEICTRINLEKTQFRRLNNVLTPTLAGGLRED